MVYGKKMYVDGVVNKINKIINNNCYKMIIAYDKYINNKYEISVDFTQGISIKYENLKQFESAFNAICENIDLNNYCINISLGYNCYYLENEDSIIDFLNINDHDFYDIHDYMIDQGYDVVNNYDDNSIELAFKESIQQYNCISYYNKDYIITINFDQIDDNKSYFDKVKIKSVEVEKIE